MEYLVTMTTHVPDGTPEQAVADVRAREAAHSVELVARGIISASLGCILHLRSPWEWNQSYL